MKQLQEPGGEVSQENPPNSVILFSETLAGKQQPQEAQTMKSAHSFTGLLLLIIVQSSWQVPDQDTEENSSLMTEDSFFNEPRALSNMKRHSEGTFSNDYSKYLETRRAQDFVQWLKNTKRNGSPIRRHADGTYTSDVSSYLQDQAAKEFVSWLKTGRGRRE
ncbi:glucagon-2-like [Lampris incognitus]|uniref:glucagon b n=1 Tax=Lampris incognitus TaxID=2546036 RepID=UPI0024B59E15|nr:glucagon b [Lampris incognitus]XP_056157983.1 glucagon-2-like [Lampris incognitus]